MDEKSRREELKDFLRSRRAALVPENLGMQRGRRRRTPGLRREEVASLADVGVTWYTWLEQGRDIKVSPEALNRIAHALRLTQSDAKYLFTLAGAPQLQDDSKPATISPHLQTVLDGMVTVPALVLGPRLDAIASNALANELFRFDEQTGPFARNQVWRMFMDRKRRRLWGDPWDREQWTEMAFRTAGVLRARYATRIGEPEFEVLLNALRASSEDFVRAWNERRTASLDSIVLRMRHPTFGTIRVAALRFQLLPDHPDEVLSTLPAADEKSAKVFSEFPQQHARSSARRR